MYTVNVLFEWDSEKARRNARKHGMGFKTATFAFDDPYALVIEDAEHSAQEPRQWLIGDSGSGVLVAVFTLRPPGGTIRIISAQRADRMERRLYEESKGI